MTTFCIQTARGRQEVDVNDRLASNGRTAIGQNLRGLTWLTIVVGSRHITLDRTAVETLIAGTSTRQRLRLLTADLAELGTDAHRVAVLALASLSCARPSNATIRVEEPERIGISHQAAGRTENSHTISRGAFTGPQSLRTQNSHTIFRGGFTGPQSRTASPLSRLADSIDAPVPRSPNRPVFQVQAVRGEVETLGPDGYRPVRNGDFLYVGTHLHTGSDGHATLTGASGLACEAVMEVQPNSLIVPQSEVSSRVRRTDGAADTVLERGTLQNFLSEIDRRRHDR